MNKELRDIILAKCDERERMGFDHLNDSDITSILEECERKNIPVTRKEIEQLGNGLNAIIRNSQTLYDKRAKIMYWSATM